MASHGNDNLFSSNQVPGQTQMRRDGSDAPNQGQGFLQETGTQVKNMAQGAADMGKGAAQGAVSVARGAALGAANIAQGAADAVKNTVGTNNPPHHDNTGSATTGGIPNYLDEFPKNNPTNPKI
ncbi:uncharacterized protein LOC132598664 [Lycium barbarum]|uniref:uncharacterized protein LOC132063713 n=1 Tax=Lycium ferocissimum TaxID=112874 RepID=UPI0028162E02|nr:uncharacterized protein LOC132063713 [Lycium ferocissimum]XP_060167652.1 uncharacterized protein LOC132598664 [Lycium barbarum]